MVDGFNNKLSLVVQCLLGLLSLLAIRFVTGSRGADFFGPSPVASEHLPRPSWWDMRNQPQGWLFSRMRLLPLAVREVPPDTATHQPNQFTRT